MKYLSFMLALCLAFTLPVLASEPDPNAEVQMYVTKVSEKSLDVALTNLQNQRTTISIVSVDRAITYYRDIIKKHNGYRKRLNLSELQDGKYILVVERGTEKRQQVIVLKKDRGMLLSAIK